jgi:hypothetical protein
MEISMRKSVAVMFVLFFLTASCLVVAKPAFSSADVTEDTWAAKAPMNQARAGLGVVAVNGKIYAMDWSYTYVYDPANDSWALKKQMPSPSLLSSLVSAVVDNKIIVTGEFSTRLGASEQKIMTYDTKNDSWSQSSTGPTIVIGGAAGATTGVKAPKRVYVLGVPYQVYDPEADAWTTATPMPTGRMDFGVAVVDDVLYVIGGYSYTSDRYDSVRPVAVNEQYIPIGYGVPPEIKVVSPVNKIYNGSSVSLVFTVDKPVNWTGYSLDGQDNITISGNTTIAGLSNGLHNVTVYARDEFENVGASETITFSVEVPFPTTLVIAPIASVAVVGVGLIVYFKKRKH